MYASAAAYCDQSAIEAWNCAACTASGAPRLQSPIYLANATTEDAGFVGKDTDGNVWVSFRGTSNIEVRHARRGSYSACRIALPRLTRLRLPLFCPCI